MGGGEREAVQLDFIKQNFKATSDFKEGKGHLLTLWWTAFSTRENFNHIYVPEIPGQLNSSL